MAVSAEETARIVAAAVQAVFGELSIASDSPEARRIGFGQLVRSIIEPIAEQIRVRTTALEKQVAEAEKIVERHQAAHEETIAQVRSQQGTLTQTIE